MSNSPKTWYEIVTERPDVVPCSFNKEIKDLWVAALRSDKWKKCVGELTKEDNLRCAAGVLAEVHPMMRHVKSPNWISRPYFYVYPPLTPPHPLDKTKLKKMDRFYFRHLPEEVLPNFEQMVIAQMNDAENDITFEEIADIIEHWISA